MSNKHFMQSIASYCFMKPRRHFWNNVLNIEPLGSSPMPGQQTWWHLHCASDHRGERAPNKESTCPLVYVSAVASRRFTSRNKQRLPVGIISYCYNSSFPGRASLLTYTTSPYATSAAFFVASLRSVPQQPDCRPQLDS